MVKCSKCGKRLRLNVPKCPKCGSKVAEVATKTFVYSIAVVALLAVIACLMLAKYGGLGCKTVSVEELRPYVESEPYIANEGVAESIMYSIDSAGSSLDSYNYTYHTIGKVRIKNIDKVSGIFTVQATFTENGKKTTSAVTHELSPGETRLFYFDYSQGDNNKKSEFAYEVLPVTRTEVKSITKYREVTKYRPELVRKTFC